MALFNTRLCASFYMSRYLQRRIVYGFLESKEFDMINLGMIASMFRVSMSTTSWSVRKTELEFLSVKSGVWCEDNCDY